MFAARIAAGGGGKTDKSLDQPSRDSGESVRSEPHFHGSKRGWAFREPICALFQNVHQMLELFRILSKNTISIGNLALGKQPPCFHIVSLFNLAQRLRSDIILEYSRLKTLCVPPFLQLRLFLKPSKFSDRLSANFQVQHNLKLPFGYENVVVKKPFSYIFFF